MVCILKLAVDIIIFRIDEPDQSDYSREHKRSGSSDHYSHLNGFMIPGNSAAIQ